MLRLTYCSFLLLALLQVGTAAEPPALPPTGDPDLVGIYRITSAEGPQATANWRGFAAITRSCGLISNHDGTAPLPFRFVTARQGGQNWIDLTIAGDNANHFLYGIYEFSGDTVRLCLATEDVNAMHGRPKSFDAANPRLVSKLILQRIPHQAPLRGNGPSAEGETN